MDESYIHWFIGGEMDHVAGTCVKQQWKHQDKQDMVHIPKEFQLARDICVYLQS